MASRQLTDLCVELRHIAYEFSAQAREAGLDLLIYCTWRSAEEQDALYEQGRTKPGRRVTNCRGGESKHNAVDANNRPAARAFDCVPMRNGKLIWDDRESYEKLHEIGKKLGLRWGGTWGDSPHFELP